MNGSPTVLSGVIAGRYAVERELGRGASSIVYLARELNGERVAIKVLRPELAESAAANHFLREIRRHSALQHPRILSLLDSGETNGQPYIVVPFMEGGTLRDLLERERQLPIADAISIARTIADALDYAHQQGLIHRDVKPENILFAGGEAYLADFGIARALETALSETSTSTGIVRGTAAYMSPEQATGEHKYDGRSDVYSLGCVLYEMLAGVPAFIGPTPEAVLAQRFAHPPRDITVYRTSVSPRLRAIVEKSLEFSPADRFKTAGEFAAALNDPTLLVATDHFPATPVQLGRAREGRAVMRRRLLVGAAVVAVAASLIVAYWRFGPTPLRFQERDWILVGDFDGPANDPQLANAVRELATAELNQSRFLSTIPRSQLSATMRLAGLSDTIRVTPQIARELAVRSAVRAVLVGSVQQIGRSNYSVVLHVVDAEDGSDIWSAAGAATDSNLILTVQRLARDLRERLGEHQSVVQATLPLEQVATPSFAAYRKYSEGLALQMRGDGRASNQLLREAIALDTGFASAWFVMAWNYQNERMLDSARWAFSQAAARRARLSEVQRYRLDADVAYALNYDLPSAIRAYDLYLSAVPRSWAGHNNRGNYLLALGRYDDALESFNRAVASHPFGPARAQIQVMNQAATLVAVGRVADAERVARDLTGPFATYIRLMISAATGSYATDSLAIATATSPSAPTWLRVQAAAVAAGSMASRGAVRSADKELAQASEQAAPDVSRWFYRARLLLAMASETRLPAPARWPDDASASASLTKGLGAVLRGDTVFARQAVRGIQSVTANERRRLGHGADVIEASLYGQHGNWRRAAEIVGAPAINGEHDSSLLDRLGSLTLRWIAADAYGRIGKVDSAAQILELAIRPERMPGNEFALRGLVVSFAHRRLAQWYTVAGRREDAAKHWRAYIDAMTTPDGDIVPTIDEARRSLAQLAR